MTFGVAPPLPCEWRQGQLYRNFLGRPYKNPFSLKFSSSISIGHESIEFMKIDRKVSEVSRSDGQLVRSNLPCTGL